MFLEVQRYLVLQALLVHQGYQSHLGYPVLHDYQVFLKVQHLVSCEFQVVLLVLEN